MEAKLFQLNKVRRLINTQGSIFHFTRQGSNEFGEPNGETVSCIKIHGVYHEIIGSNNYLSKRTTDATTLRQKSLPRILCLWEEGKNLLHTDRVSIHGVDYTIGEVQDLSNAGVIAEVYLEEDQKNA